MEFLPLEANGKDVYAGFGPRFGAAIIDTLILFPVSILLQWITRQNLTVTILVTAPLMLFGIFFHVFFNSQYGGTPGKMALGIRIVKPDGSAIGWTEAWKRQSVTLAFSIILMCKQYWILMQLDPVQYASLAWREQAAWMRELQPNWLFIVSILQGVWMLTDIIVFFSNKRRRAAHDFIAGTVVIHKAFAQKKQVEDQTA